MEKFLLNVSSNPNKSNVFWNILSNSWNSIVSILLLWLVTLANGTSDAGIFSLGFSTAQMMLTVGNFGMRNFQASDIKNKYSPQTYLKSRYITSAVMVLMTAIFVAVKGYYLEKTCIVLLLCVLKITDAIDDVYGGYYQKLNRLDIAGKILFVRVMGYSCVFAVTLFLTHDLIFSILAAVISASFLLKWMVSIVNRVLAIEKEKMQIKVIVLLLKDCIPLCLGAFLLVYMGNAPKYAIDQYLSNEMQAYYNYLFMPCFVINLFVGFVLQPLLVKLSLLWEERKYKEFKKISFIIYGCTLGISAGIVLAGRLCGCFLLGIFYGVSLGGYQEVLTILLIGGGMFALAVITQTMLVIMRHQYITMWGFLVSNIVITVLSPVLVKKYELMGAAEAYTIAAAVLFVMLFVCAVFYYIKEGKCEK